MERERVESSAIASVGYDSDSRILEIEFLGGKVYRYFLVSEEQYRALLSADSIGAFVNRTIKPFHPCEEI